MLTRRIGGEYRHGASTANRAIIPPVLNLPGINTAVAALLARELDEVAIVFERQLASELTAVNALCAHVERYRGKMLRPTLVLLSGLAAQGDDGSGSTIDERHRTLGAVTEMIHMATLVHDDVLDEANMRRGGPTMNHLRGNELAVMLGDYLISNAFHLCSTLGDPAINLALGAVTNTLCEGELLQLHHRHDHGIDQRTYFEIIHRKTASLIGACCRLGGALGDAPVDVVAALDRAGVALGIAFQIQDDLLDLVGEESVVGKSVGRDLAKGKLTLPMIDALERAEAGERARILDEIESCDGNALRDRLLGGGCVDRARLTAERYVEKAIKDLEKLPEGPAKSLFIDVASTVVSRRR